MPHTKGNWEVIPTPETLNGGDYQARIISKGALSDGNDAIIVGHYSNKNGVGNIHYEANAKLIAAAPDLLDALKKLIYGHKIYQCFDSEIEKANYLSALSRAKEAIKKATE